ncbi:hypothetical protein IMZ08_02745 [Bacillus luteolus]|uniref:Uncharacterized protein n=1 Tax=Litchfieldia luteola TaxID=682179 RepID=A0ABR9QFF0_9BACI|nr:hypothetical protein [Cytobacillus luteolus]MBE4906974.1 hypothetical protein [Cytobacillus luteolus]MBP1943560.1 hypothetical protein [Cytobacillus luteolus]
MINENYDELLETSKKYQRIYLGENEPKVKGHEKEAKSKRSKNEKGVY